MSKSEETDQLVIFSGEGTSATRSDEVSGRRLPLDKGVSKFLATAVHPGKRIGKDIQEKLKQPVALRAIPNAAIAIKSYEETAKEKILGASRSSSSFPNPFRLRKALEEAKDQHALDDAGVPDVPPDMTLHNMDVVIKKMLKGVSVKNYYETIWSEGVHTDRAPFYGPWLSDGGKNEVNVEDWVFADSKNEFEGWNGETYPQKRVVDIKFIRTTHLYAGPPVINVRHTQYCRNDGNDRCILQMTIEFEGVPLSDTFNVEVRLVASRVGTGDLLIEVGVVVVFVKSNILASQIKAGAKEETTKGQTNLLEHIVLACDAETVESPDNLEGVPEATEPIISCSRLGDFFSQLFKRRRGVLADRDDQVAQGVRNVDTRLKAVIAALEKSSPSMQRETEILDDLASANSALDHVLSCLS